VLVVGPKAVTSDYVQQEWQFAWREADKVVTPILRLGDYPLVPDELKLLPQVLKTAFPVLGAVHRYHDGAQVRYGIRRGQRRSNPRFESRAGGSASAL
jgi:hypothetical protein